MENPVGFFTKFALKFNLYRYTEGNVLDRAKAAKEVTRLASLKAQKMYHDLEIAAHHPAVSEVGSCTS